MIEFFLFRSHKSTLFVKVPCLNAFFKQTDCSLGNVFNLM